MSAVKSSTKGKASKATDSAKESIKGSSKKMGVKNYREASSDDEFAKEHFMFSSDEESFTPKSGRKRQRDDKSSSDNASRREESDSEDEDDEDKIDYRIEHILGRRSMTAKEWIPITDKMQTREITKGSVLQQPDEEYYDPSDLPVEKFLIKWSHASYLHVSWETEKDLVDLVGKGVKHSLKKYLQREAEGRELFEDLAQGEFFPSSYVQIERILDVDDKDINMATINWEKVGLPEIAEEATDSNETIQSSEPEAEPEPEPETSALDMDTEKTLANAHNATAPDTNDDAGSESDPFASSDDESVAQPVRRPARRAAAKKIIYSEDSDEEAVFGEEATKIDTDDIIDLEDSDADNVTKNNSTNQKQIRSQKAAREKKKEIMKKKKPMKKNQYLHGENCWVTVKWEGLMYSDVSFESLNDIIRAKIDYESPLRAFYKREQAPPKESQLNGARKLNVDHTIIGPTAEQPPFPGGELRDYQWEGVRWMLFNLMQSRNSILADEMGLGKTIQSSALLHMLKKHQKVAGPFLVVAPLSTIVNWQREVRSWTNLDAIMYYGSQEDRELIRSYEFNFLDKKKKGYKVEVVITTPETCMATDEKTSGRMKRVLSRIAWDLVIIDEAHKLKNYDSKLSSTLREEYSYRNCVLLTGTPLQNNTEELWTLLNFVGPSDFADHEDFMEKFGDLKSTTQLEELHRRIKPYLLRREKENVEKTVPPKEEIVIEVELTVPQKQYYRAIFEQKTGFLYRANMKDGPSLTNLAMELRKCCNHPYLIKGAPTEIAKHFKDDSHQDILVKSSGKMTLLAKLLPKLKADGHRVLIFSQFRMMLDIMEDCIHHAGYSYERVDGSIVGSKRQAAIDRFTNNDNIFIMLLSTKAGGVGINLTAADTVIIYDSDWNPQNDIQAQARAHRIGQTRSVTVYRLLTRKTYEMAMFRAASIKLGLDYAVMHNLNQSATLMTAAANATTRGRGNKQQQQQQLAGISAERAETVSALSRKELENLLKHGAYDIFMEEKDGKSENESKMFVEESIEQILERSSIFLHQENDSKVECMKPTSSFAKASFVSATGPETDVEEVAIDDPDFWSKVVGLSVEDQAIAMGSKRKCRANVESYKEPGMSIKSIYGDRKNAYMSESEEGSGDEDERGSKRRRKPAEPELVPAEFTAEHLQYILTAMGSHGYGSWSTIRRVTKLWWQDSDIAKACTFNMLGCMMWASLTSSSSTEQKKNVTATSANREMSSEEATSLNDKSEENNSDNAANEEMNVDQVANNNPTDTTSATATLKFDANMFMTLLKRYKGCKVAFAAYLQHAKSESETATSSEVTEDKLLKVFISKLNNLTFELPLPSLSIRKAFQSAMVSTIQEQQSNVQQDSEEGGEGEESFMTKLASDLIATFAAHEIGQEVYNVSAETDISKLQKRAAASRSKLAQIEDLFETRFYAEYSVKVAKETQLQEGVLEENKVMMDVDVSTAEASVVVGQEEEATVKETEPVRANVLKQLGGRNSSNNDAETSQEWTVEHDHTLLLAVQRFGAPDGKRRYVQIMDYLSAHHADIEYVNPSTVTAAAAAAAASASSAVENSTENNNGVAPVSNDQETGANSEAHTSAAPAANNANSGIHEKYTPKFLVARLKTLVRTLRCTDEELAALAKQEAAAAAAIAKQQAAEAKLKNADAKAKAAEKQLKKKHVQQVFKTLGRIGYPRSVYEAMKDNLRSVLASDSEAFEKRTAHLLSWETFAQECDVAATLDIAAIQEAVTGAIEVLNNPDLIGGVDGTCTSGILEDVSYKTLDSAFEKVDTIHHIRILFALHSEEDLKQLIKASCKIAGPDVPTFRRDTSMPVWWTLQHDLELLKLCTTLGLNQWKKLTAEPLMSTAPADFDMPPKVHGTEWILALTTKNAEKRVQALLRGLPAMRTLSLPTPTSPQRKSSQRTASSSSMFGGMNTLAAAFSNIAKANSSKPPAMSTPSVASATPASAAAAVVVVDSDTKNETPVAVATALPTSNILVVVDSDNNSSSTFMDAKHIQEEDDEVVLVNTPLKVSAMSPSSTSSASTTTAAAATTMAANSTIVVVDTAVEMIVDEVTPSRADETSASKQDRKMKSDEGAIAFERTDDDAMTEKINMLVDASASSVAPVPVEEKKAPPAVSAGKEKKAVSAKKAEKAAAAAPPTKSILSFFKRS